MRSIRGLPAGAQWKRLPLLLSAKEAVALAAAAAAFLASLTALGILLYRANTVVVPADGGVVREGIVGSPSFLNPVYAPARDADRDLVELLYAGLMRFDEEGNPIPDLARSVSIEEGGRTYVVDLREDLRWNDGYPITAEDVVFTVETIQNPRYASPVRADWVGINVEQVSGSRVRFQLREAFSPFLERLTLKVLPAHAWREVGPENFPLVRMNLRPVASGPYEVREVRTNADGSIREIELKRNRSYHGPRPHIAAFAFRFFASEEDLLKEARRGSLDAFLIPSSAPSLPGSYAAHRFSLPRYFSLFFNMEDSESGLDEKRIREALLGALDTERIAEIAGPFSRPVSSPVLPGTFSFPFNAPLPDPDPEGALALLEKEGYEKRDGWIYPPSKGSTRFTRRLQEGSRGEEVRMLQECLAQDSSLYPDGIVSGIYGPKTAAAVSAFQERYADEILQPYGYDRGTGSVGPSTQAKLNKICFPDDGTEQPFEVAISTLDQAGLLDTAQEVKRQWEELGIKTRILSFSISELEQEVIAPRAYEILLFGEVLGRIPDPFPFWHSTQATAPGVNFSLYEDREADIILENIRAEHDEAKRVALYKRLQEVIEEDTPAAFLYASDAAYAVKKSIKGVAPGLVSSPSQRFSGVHEWYMETARSFK